MAGTLSFTRAPMKLYDGYVIGEIVTVTWVSDSSGNADISIPDLKGWLTEAKTVPSATVAPTDNYDIKLKDSAGFDVLEGALNDRDTANTEIIPTANSGKLALRQLFGTYTFDVTNAGNAKGGTCAFKVQWA